MFSTIFYIKMPNFKRKYWKTKKLQRFKVCLVKTKKNVISPVFNEFIAFFSFFYYQFEICSLISKQIIRIFKLKPLLMELTCFKTKLRWILAWGAFKVWKNANFGQKSAKMTIFSNFGSPPIKDNSKLSFEMGKLY